MRRSWLWQVGMIRRINEEVAFKADVNDDSDDDDDGDNNDDNDDDDDDNDDETW